MNAETATPPDAIPAGDAAAAAQVLPDDLDPPLRTALYEAHRSAGARLIDFAGWEMPVQYSGIIDEHRAVRSRPECSTCRTWASCG